MLTSWRWHSIHSEWFEMDLGYHQRMSKSLTSATQCKKWEKYTMMHFSPSFLPVVKQVCKVFPVHLLQPEIVLVTQRNFWIELSSMWYDGRIFLFPSICPSCLAKCDRECFLCLTTRSLFPSLLTYHGTWELTVRCSLAPGAAGAADARSVARCHP